MTSDIGRQERTASRDLHPRVYGALGIAVLWFALAVWGFAGNGYADYLLAIVSGFIVMAVAIPCILWHVGKTRDVPDANHENDAAHHTERSFHDWASADFITWQGRLSGANAAVEILLPIAVAAFGMTAFGIVFAIVLHMAARHAV